MAWYNPATWFSDDQPGTPARAEVLYAQDYPWYGGAQEQLAQFGQRELGRVERGEPSTGFSKLAPQLSADALRNLSQAYMGIPGLGPGILGAQLGIDIGRGFGGRDVGTSRQSATLADQWGQKARDIGTYIAGLGYQDYARSAQQIPELLRTLPQGPRMAGIAQFPGQEAEPSTIEKLLGMAAGVAPYFIPGVGQVAMANQAMSGIGDWLGGMFPSRGEFGGILGGPGAGGQAGAMTPFGQIGPSGFTWNPSMSMGQGDSSYGSITAGGGWGAPGSPASAVYGNVVEPVKSFIGNIGQIPGNISNWWLGG
jgi:hypothetical protein